MRATLSLRRTTPRSGARRAGAARRRFVAVVVVHPLEAVEVHQQHAQPGGAGDSCRARIGALESAAVEQAGERIALGLRARLVLGALALGDVVDDALQEPPPPSTALSTTCSQRDAIGVAALEIRARRLAALDDRALMRSACRPIAEQSARLAPPRLVVLEAERPHQRRVPFDQAALRVEREQPGPRVLEDQPPLALGRGVQATRLAFARAPRPCARAGR